jgi:hypothetical protein
MHRWQLWSQNDLLFHNSTVCNDIGFLTPWFLLRYVRILDLGQGIRNQIKTLILRRSCPMDYY